MAGQADQENGTFMRGADGKLYFIPERVLTQCKMPDDHAAAVEPHLAQGTEPPNVQFSEPQLRPEKQVRAPRTMTMSWASSTTGTTGSE